MKYIIFDLEATCWKTKEEAPCAQEVIEIGAVKLDDAGNLISEFDTFVKPTECPILSDFCKELTTITQDQVDGALEFPEAVKNFRDWIGYDDDFLLCSWGEWDKHHLVNQAKKNKMEHEWFTKHINLKEQYRVIRMHRRQVGMKMALKLENIELEGAHHRGIDDAINIAKIFKKLIGRWKHEEVYFFDRTSKTNKLEG
jgi:3'-5' exoribonuclease 1